ncbi:hypothetical protein [Paraburkholderia kururiensis]|uniref:hypothetical protein n=1 Tax=Paraburkholderia kururiensis TaxID=984307 RepID=UPI0005AADBA3|nr:hypothetical protein [Paraburkholderia kururiensis]
MVALLSKFRRGDRVRIDATDETLSEVDGWRGRVAVIGPADACGAHSQVPEGYALVEVERDGDAPLQFWVPLDQLAFDL